MFKVLALTALFIIIPIGSEASVCLRALDKFVQIYEIPYIKNEKLLNSKTGLQTIVDEDELDLITLSSVFKGVDSVRELISGSRVLSMPERIYLTLDEGASYNVAYHLININPFLKYSLISSHEGIAYTSMHEYGHSVFNLSMVKDFRTIRKYFEIEAELNELSSSSFKYKRLTELSKKIEKKAFVDPILSKGIEELFADFTTILASKNPRATYLSLVTEDKYSIDSLKRWKRRDPTLKENSISYKDTFRRPHTLFSFARVYLYNKYQNTIRFGSVRERREVLEQIYIKLKSFLIEIKYFHEKEATHLRKIREQEESEALDIQGQGLAKFFNQLLISNF